MSSARTHRLIAGFLCGITATAFAQIASTPNSIEENLGEIKAGLFTGIAEKNLARKGDETAHWITENYSIEQLADPKLQKAIAIALEMSFAHPDLIETPHALSPKFSTILIGYLMETAKSDAVRASLTQAQRSLVHPGTLNPAQSETK